MIKLLLILTVLLIGCKDECFSREVGDCATTYIECWTDCFDLPEPDSYSDKCLDKYCKCLEKAGCKNDCSYKRSCESPE